MILKGCLYILNFLHDVSIETETFTNKMELASTIWEAFKTLGYSSVWGGRGKECFRLKKIVKGQPETA